MDWPYAIELRNHKWLTPEYLPPGCLNQKTQRITHVFNSWDAMPSVAEQMATPGSRTNPKLFAARFLLKPGRKYWREAVKTFKPYDKVKEVNEEARKAGKALIAEKKSMNAGQIFIYVNNRLEGNATGNH